MLTLKPGLICAIVLASSGLEGCHSKAIPMTPEEIETVGRITSDVVPRCLGRYVIDMPRAFSLNSEATAEVEQVKISVLPMKRPTFDLRLKARQAKLKSDRIHDRKSTPSLLEARPLPDNGGLIFNRSRTQESAVGRAWELMGWKDGFAFRLVIDARDMSFEEHPFPHDTRETDMAQKFATLLSVYERVRGREENEIPQGPGMCIAHGFVAGKANDHEEMTLSYQLDGTPDVYFHADIGTPVRETSTLLERSDQLQSDMPASGVTTLRIGKRKIHSQPYEEWLMKGPTPAHIQGALFTLHGNETSTDPGKPFVILEFSNGFRIPAPERTAEESAQLKDLTEATLTDAEAVAIWDKVSATLRVRPGAF
jgi:Tle cognate immunity protein 4 C-terminal domain/Tle cognate immunity protein 4 N-terminal domain